MDEIKYLEKIILLFKEEGLHLSMEEIADRIGVTKKTLYNRFLSKEELISKCMAVVTEDFKREVNCLDDTSIPVIDGFESGVSALRVFFKEMSPIFLKDLMKYFPQMANNDHAFGSSYFQGMLLRNIERGKQEGVYRVDVDAELLSKYISFSIFAFYRQSVMLHDTYSADYYFHQVIDFNLNALSSKNLANDNHFSILLHE